MALLDFSSNCCARFSICASHFSWASEASCSDSAALLCCAAYRDESHARRLRQDQRELADCLVAAVLFSSGFASFKEDLPKLQKRERWRAYLLHLGELILHLADLDELSVVDGTIAVDIHQAHHCVEVELTDRLSDLPQSLHRRKDKVSAGVCLSTPVFRSPV